MYSLERQNVKELEYILKQFSKIINLLVGYRASVLQYFIKCFIISWLATMQVRYLGDNLPISIDVASDLSSQFGINHDLIQIMDADGVDLELMAFGYPGGKMKEDFYRTDREDSESSMPHTNGTVRVEVVGAKFVAHIRRISKNEGLKKHEEYHLLALHIDPNAFAHLDEDDSVLESLTEALEDVICH